jgi:uncharacterized protein (TIGR02246 family)
LTLNPLRRFDGHMKSNIFIALLLFSVLCTTSAADIKAVEQALRDINAQWSATAASKDLEKTVSFYSDDAIVMPPNAPAETSREAIRKGWKDLLDTASDISWKTTRVEIAESGDLAVLTGIYDVTMKDGTKDHGKYCEVWEKQSDGKWKCGTDMFSSDLPAAPATSPAPGAAERK